MWIAIFETPRSSFHAYGNTEARAKKALTLLWRLYAFENRMKANYLEKYYDEVVTEEIREMWGNVDGECRQLEGVTLTVGSGDSVPLEEVTDEQLDDRYRL